MPTYTPAQVAERANVHANSIRKWSVAYADLLTPAARGEDGNRLYTDADVSVLCAVAALRKTGLSRDDIIEHLQNQQPPPVVDVAPTPPLHHPYTPPHEADTADNTLAIHTAYTALHAAHTALHSHVDTLAADVTALKRWRETQEASRRTETWWHRLEGAAIALGIGGFLLWLLYLFW